MYKLHVDLIEAQKYRPVFNLLFGLLTVPLMTGKLYNIMQSTPTQQHRPLPHIIKFNQITFLKHLHHHVLNVLYSVIGDAIVALCYIDRLLMYLLVYHTCPEV